MFVLDQEPKFTHPVTVNTPVDGGFESQTFKVTFKVMGVDELATYDFNTQDGSTKFLQAVVAGFGDVQGADGQELPFSDKARNALIDVPYVRVALVKAYFAGIGKAQLGN